MKLRPFELVMAVGFGIMAVAALVMLAMYKPATSRVPATVSAPVLIWGTISSSAVNAVIEGAAKDDPSVRLINYVQKNPDTFDSDLLNALADRVGPDVIIIPHEHLVQYRRRLQPFTYNEFPLPDFRQSYVDGAEIFAMQDGVYAVPLVVDPIVLYANRDVLATYNFANPPATWEAMVNDYIPTLVQRDFNRTIQRSPLAFGEFRNVQNSFAVVSLLLLQRGSLMVQESSAGRYELRLEQTRDGGGTALTQVLDFYTSFANPTNLLYTWNRSLPLDRRAFVNEDLVFYFGKGSEAQTIALQNPNLNFTLSEVPQGATATIRRTYGTFYGLAMMRTANNKTSARQAMTIFSTQNAQQIIANSLGMSPVFRTMVGAGSNDRFGREVYRSALVARGWWSPNLVTTDAILTEAVEDILANRARPTSAASDVSGRLRGLY